MANEQTARVGGVGLPKGARIGKYEVVEQIGAGGQAVIYKCHDPLLDRYVAAKQISPHLAADPKFMERFRKEAQILAKLGAEQGAIVTIHDMVEDERGLFIIMEYLAGHSLETILQDTKGPVEPKAALQVVWRLAAALHVVHSAGIIHRDLKPSNIIICEGLRPKITDFGVAASMSGQTSMLLGTTKYMAPELFEGSRVDGRADMYSLGMIAYEMLAGRPRFNEIFAEIVRDRHSESVRWMKWHGNPAVKAPPLHEVNPAVPRPLSDIVARMMTKDPDGRFESMEALGRAIKTTFSPRARAAAPAAAPAQPTRLRRRPSRAPAAAISSEQAEEAALVQPDAGDELEVAPEAAATAPLPPRLTGRKILIYFVLPVVGLIGLGGVIGGVIHAVQQARLADQQARALRAKYEEAYGLYVEALKTYDQAKFQAAAAGFAEVQKKHPGTREAGQASFWQLVCEGYVAAGQGAWEQATSRMMEAAQRRQALQAGQAELTEWARKVAGDLDSFAKYRTSTRIFREAIAKAQKALDARQFGEARDVLQRDLREVTPTPAQEEELKRFRAEVDRTEFLGLVEAQVQQAEDLVARNKFKEAEAAYQEAQKLLADDQKAGVLAAEERTKRQRDLAARITQLTGDMALREAAAAVEQARTGGDRIALLAALRALEQIRPAPGLKDEIAAIQSDLALERGRKLKGEGKAAEARAAFEESIRLKDNKLAREELAAMDRADARAVKLGEGDKAFAAGQWDEALRHYKEAAELGTDDLVLAKITECSFRILLGRADKLIADRKYDEAIPALEEARKVKPASAALIDARLEAIAADRKYAKAMEDGRAALEREQYVRALDLFRQAQAVRNTEEVKTAIAETRYRENLARGKEAMLQNDFQGALGYLNLARGFKDTQEVRDLIKEAEEKRKKAGG